jgi:hypothetical protein
MREPDEEGITGQTKTKGILLMCVSLQLTLDSGLSFETTLVDS